MNVLVSGSTGLVGSALVESLAAAGHRITRLVRHMPAAGQAEIRWDPAAGFIQANELEGLDAVVHLAGENVAAKRWTALQKTHIRDSRVIGTRLLTESIARLAKPPRTFLSASAVGYYGTRGDEILKEESPAGEGFLPDVCRDWEKAVEPVILKGIRVVKLRIGVVLSPAGGALGRMLLPFKLGLGGKIGSGRQYMSWIAIDDCVAAILHALETSTLMGPVNLTSPNPSTNLEFTRTLGNVLGRPTIFPMPAFAARLAFGEMADALLLASTRVIPAKLQAAGFPFQHPDLETALKNLLGK